LTIDRTEQDEVSAEAPTDRVRAGRIRLRPTRRPRRQKRRSAAVRVLRVLALALLLVASIVGALLWRLQSGPVSADALTDRVAQALEARFGDGFDVQIRHSQIEWPQEGPRLSVTGVTVRDAQGNLVVAAPQADISFDPAGLAFGQFMPRDISFVGPAVALTIAPDGVVSVSATGEDEQRTSAPAGDGGPPAAPAGPAPAPGSAFGPAALLDPLLTRAGPLAVLERAGIRDGRLRVNDLRRGRTVTYDRLSLQFSRPNAEETRLRVSARGPVGSWSFQADVAGRPGERRELRVDVRNVSVAEFIGFSDPGTVPATTDMPINGDFALSLAPDNAITALTGRITGGSAIVMFEHPDAEPVFVDSMQGEFGWDAAAHAVTVTSLQLAAGDTQWRLRGRVGVPQVDGAFWTVDLASDGSALAGDGPQDKPVQIDRLTLRARLPIGMTGVQVDTFEVAGPEVALAMTAVLGRVGDVDGLRLGLTAGRMPVRNVLAFWPSIIASDVRTWLIDTVQGGTVEAFSLASSLTPAGIADAFAERPLPDEAVRLDVRVVGGSMRPGKGMPLIEDITAQATVTGRTARVNASRGTIGAAGRGIALSNVVVTVDDTAAKPPVLQIESGVAGSAETAFEALRAPAIRPFSSLPTDVTGVRGQVDARVQIRLPLLPVPKPSDVVVQLTGQATGITADGLLGREKLEGGAFTFSQGKGGLQVKGEGRLSGSPATFELRQATAGGATDATATLTLDDAGRARRGLKLPGQITGPIDVRVSVADASGPKPVTKVEADLAKAAISDVIPGWTKPAGRPARLGFRLEQDAEQTTLDDLVLDAAGGVQVKGTVRLGADGMLQSARLSSLRLSPGDDIRIDAERQGGVLKQVVRATQIDARPLLRAAMAPGGSQIGSPGDMELDLKAQTIVGENNEKLSAVDLKLAIKGGDIRDLRMAGRFGNSPVSAQPVRAEGGAPGFVIESGDAGSFLRFFEIYRRMIGGTLILQLYGSPPQMTGEIIANSFTLANEPALARVAPGDPEKGNGVAFTKLRAGFNIGGGRLDIRDGTMWGAAVGGTLEGVLDFNRDRVDLSGTFVPAYGINNALNRVPIVGTLLGGGQNEGLFAVNFRITGRVTQPAVSINPLSAVAPGVLRKFFGVFGPGVSVGGGAGSAPPAQQQPAPASPPEQR
jgi:hypothetical protein